jgi:hypothetical protein
MSGASLQPMTTALPSSSSLLWSPSHCPPSAPTMFKEAFDLVVFDLDNTLVPVMPPIDQAINAMIKFAEIYMPYTAMEIKNGVLAANMKRLSYHIISSSLCFETPLT